MRIFEKAWVRVIISLLMGAIIVGFVTISYSTDPDHPVSFEKNGMYAMILGGIIYFIMTPLVKQRIKKY